jgi:hypothetical protein
VNCTDIEERAAIRQYDGGLSRDDSETQTVADCLDAGLPELPCIMGEAARELVRVDRRRRHHDLAADLVNARNLYGFDHVVFAADGDTYRPAIGGEPADAALIVPADDGYGGIADLVACTLAAPHHMRSRYGAAAIIGLAKVELAREADTPLLVFDHAIRWLYARSHGAVIVDWNRAAREIEGVKTLLCPKSLAPRLREATRRCWPRPTIAFAEPEAMRHAA